MGISVVGIPPQPLENLPGITITEPADDQFLRYDGSTWTNETVALTGTLDGLSDVTIATPAEGHTLYYDASSGQWKNNPRVVFDDVNKFVGITTSATLTPEALLHLEGGSPGGTPPADTLLYLDDTSPNMAFMSNATGTASIYFGDTASNTAGQIQYDHSADVLRAKVASTTHLSLHHNSNVHRAAFGSVTTPDSRLHVHDASAGTVTAATNTVLTVENSAAAYVSMLTPNNATAGMLFGDPDDNDVGQLVYDHTDNSLRFVTNGAQGGVLASGGLWGVGQCTAPVAYLHAAGSGGAGVISERLTTSNGPALVARRSHSTTFGTYSAVLSGDYAGFFFQMDDGSAYGNASQINSVATENWSGTARGCKLTFTTTDNTTLVNDIRMTIDQDGGLFMAGATGGSKGVGTINATAVYDDNVLLTDYVFEPDYDLASIEETTAFYNEHKHLPTIVGADEWAQRRASVGELVTQIWETVEVQARHITQLHDRLATLETTNG